MKGIKHQIKMKLITIPACILILCVTILNCSSPKHGQFKAKEIYQSTDLRIIQIAENSFQHISFLQTNDFGNVPCNGLIVRNGEEAIVFDTPTNDKSSEELIKWVNESLNCKINAVIPTHFHNDCLAGLKAFDEHHIPSYAYFKTIELAKENDFIAPKNSFNDSLSLRVGDATITAKFFGEGHTQDNIIGYFPDDNVMFGGCLIKELNASKGYLGDATVTEWSGTVEKVKQAYPHVKLIVPGHGKPGNNQLLDYTIDLFKTR
jgi:metallo-beta-lactamase class B